jgi:hypothetical protein
LTSSAVMFSGTFPSETFSMSYNLGRLSSSVNAMAWSDVVSPSPASLSTISVSQLICCCIMSLSSFLKLDNCQCKYSSRATPPCS